MVAPGSVKCLPVTDSSNDSDPVSLHTDGMFSNEQASGDPSFYSGLVTFL